MSITSNAHAGNPDILPLRRANEAPNDPHRLAKLFLDAHRDNNNILKLRFWQDQLHEWSGSRYAPLGDSDLRARLANHVKEEFDRVNLEELATWSAAGQKGKPPVARPVTKSLVGNVAQALGGLCIVPGQLCQPAWLGEHEPFPANEVLATRSGLIHLPGYVEGRPDYGLPKTPLFFNANAVDYDFHPEAPEPVQWLNFLAHLWPDDPQSIDTLRQWFGYLLTPDTRQQKILMLVGPRRSGKGTIGRVLRALVGPDNTASPTLGGLAGNFGLWPLLGKSVAVVADARLNERGDQAAVTERLLSISGEDALAVDRKYLPPVTTKLGVRFVILTNELPRLNDSSGALAGRLIVLRLTESWYGKEDHNLTDRLLGELPGILRWSVEGWRRLRETGRLVQPESGKPLVRDVEDLASPVGAFLRERCVVGPEYSVPVAELYGGWRGWCEEHGRREPGTVQSFGRYLRSVVPTLDEQQLRRGGGRIRVYVGLTLTGNLGDAYEGPRPPG
jgi:putative DNA primase/helicase